MKKTLLIKYCFLISIVFLFIFSLCGCKKDDLSIFKNKEVVGNLKTGIYEGKKYLIGCNFKKGNTVNITDDLGVEIIYRKAFNYKIPKSYDGIGDYHFIFESFTLSKTVKEIEDVAQSIKIENFYYDGTISDLCSIDHGGYIDTIFERCTNIYILDSNGNVSHDWKTYKLMEDIIIPSDVNVIKKRAFSYNRQIKNVILEEGVTKIEDYAFMGCDSLRTFEMPDSVIEVGHSAFNMCSKLRTINLSDKITTISGSLFYRCSRISEITIPSGVKEIQMSAFCGCDRLKSIELPDGIEIIEDEAFAGCNRLNSITLPASLKKLGSNALPKIDYVGQIVIPAGVTEIVRAAFDGNNENGSIVLLGKQMKIDRCAFMNVRKISYIVLPDETEDIYLEFLDYTTIDYLVLSKDIEEMNVEMIDGKGTINHVCYTGTQEEWNNVKFYTTEYSGSKIEYCQNPDVKVYFYSETEPADSKTDYWHYVNGKPSLWSE